MTGLHGEGRGEAAKGDGHEQVKYNSKHKGQ